MGAYLIRRLLLVIPTLWAIITINFFIVQIAPGGPVSRPSPLLSSGKAGHYPARAAKAFAPATRKPALETSATVIIEADGVWIRRLSPKSLAATGSISLFMSVISKCSGTMFVSISAIACFVAPQC